MARTRRREQAEASDVVRGQARVQMEYTDINNIYPYEDNPRENEAAVESVANSIRAFNFLVPIVVDRDGVIVAGHTRHAAAMRVGLTEVPVIRAEDLSEDQARQFRIIDNKVSELARWDMGLLSSEFEALAESGIVWTDFGYSQDEVDCLSDMVQDDCLSATGFMNEDDRNRAGRADPRAPAQARMVLSEFVFFIPMDVYRRWANEVRSVNEYDETAIIEDLQRRLGMTPYLEADD